MFVLVVIIKRNKISICVYAHIVWKYEKTGFDGINVIITET